MDQIPSPAKSANLYTFSTWADAGRLTTAFAVSSSASAYRTHMYSHPFFAATVMSPTWMFVAFGLAAKR